MLSDFFKKEVTAYPAGSKTLGDKSRTTAYSRALAKAGMFITAVAMAASLTSCGPSREQIDALKANVPDSLKKELIARCDSSMLANIDAAFTAGGRNTNSSVSPFGVVLENETGEKMANSVMSGYRKAKNQMYDTIPSPSQRTGEHYVLIDYMNECSHKAIGSKTEMKLCMTADADMALRPVNVDYGKPEFRKELAGKVKARQAEKAVQAAKAVQQGGR